LNILPSSTLPGDGHAISDDQDIKNYSIGLEEWATTKVIGARQGAKVLTEQRTLDTLITLGAFGK
jgi:hypothetical protein